MPSEASTSGFSEKWVTTGGTTLAVTDLRKGVLAKSANQEEELLCSVFVGRFPSMPGRSKGENILAGGSNGVLTLWERDKWYFPDERITVRKGGWLLGESLEALALMPDGVGDGGKNVVVGVTNGKIWVVKLGPNKVFEESLHHDEWEAVVALGFDIGGRMISGGGEVVKVWQEELVEDRDLDDDEEDDSDNDDKKPISRKRRGSNSDDDDDDSSSDEDSGRRRKRNKKKGIKGKDKYAGNGVIGFKGLD
jgi:hypothetical protein